ncbi:putative lysophospholipase III [Monocercomonoides exilis]|uniref:putative lysophospholipase III n=1 Tax=Monocercomonoides exilis TaxID=2049356 RepID=UPI003559BEFD|nr:putative lysophospholipase III [Monocercomonoides exilis]|eukprot:MONOS_4226.1-p1 / transcript=MONOS_4226.1 / gene=MONOS_4226 / organism=Monocercomonoides_exilis_PA203 / gene_product= lysophospholipase III [EC:3.1.1.5] / transcript_product= lysophospholipase III [EC:3.1.1.5] / location=Mono_scaffold00110:10229-11790(-) / protein_length=388 / sequence_SO=supercontig / SO=protein_coding / is_pseudo=false
MVKTYSERNDLDPVILLPGLGGSRIEYHKNNDAIWKPLWLDISRALPGKYKEYVRELTVMYDSNTDTFSSQPDIVTRPIDFGGIEGVEYLDKNFKNMSGMYSVMIKAMKEVGYEVGKNLFGAPFDFRLANAKHIMQNGMSEKLKQLIEHAASCNPGKKVHLVGHSMGCTFIHQFLVKYVTEGWKKRYIASFISISGPYGGSFEALAHLSSPHMWNEAPIPASIIHEMISSWASLYWMLPNFNAFQADSVIASIPKAQMTVTMGNMTSLWSTTNRTSVLRGVESTMKYVNMIDPPNVPVHVFYSKGIKTLRQLKFEGDATNWWKSDCKGIYGDGDDTVPIESLMTPLRWKEMQSDPVTSMSLDGAHHITIVHNGKLVDEIVNIISRNL